MGVTASQQGDLHLELSINVMKYTLHKWGGNISSIHNVIGPLKKNYRQAGQKKWKKLGQFPSEGGSHVPTFFKIKKGEKKQKKGRKKRKKLGQFPSEGGGSP